MLSPQVRMLEPRFVLNATAELNAMGQLLVMGSDQPDSVLLEVQPAGLVLIDGDTGQPINIANHPDDPVNGSDTPLDPAAVNLIRFDMGDGDDILDLQLPSAIKVEVAPSDGQADETTLRFLFPGDPSANDDVVVHSDIISLEPSTVSLANRQVELFGDVSFGTSGVSTLALDGGSLKIVETLILSGDVDITGPGAVDLSNAVITADTADASLSVDIGQDAGSFFALGGANDSGGHLVKNLSIDSADSVTLGPMPTSLGGDLTIEGVSRLTQIDSMVEAKAVTIITDGDVMIDGSVETSEGAIKVSTTESLTIEGRLDTTDAGDVGTIDLMADNIRLVDAELLTSGALIKVDGPTAIDGDVKIDSGEAMASVAGDVLFTSTIRSDDASGNTLKIDALGVTTDGVVKLQGPVGATMAAPDVPDLNGVAVQAARIETESIGVTNGDITLRADLVELIGKELRTSASGDILVDGPLLLPKGDTNIKAAGSVRFTSTVTGQPGTQDLMVMSGPGGNDDVNFDDSLSGVRNLSVMAGGLAQFAGTVSLRGNLNANAKEIRVLADVDTTVDNPGGEVRLTGTSLVLVENGAVVDVGAGVIVINAGPDAPPPGSAQVDVGDATLRSTNVGDAITISSGSSVLLGNIEAQNGNFTVGLKHQVTGPTNQEAGTTVKADRFTASTVGLIDLSNSGNVIKTLQSVSTLDGSITIDSDSTIRVLDVESRNIFSSDDAGGAGGPDSRDISITAHGATSDILIGPIRYNAQMPPVIRALAGADVFLMAGDDILGVGTEDAKEPLIHVKSDDLSLVAYNQTADGPIAIQLVTYVNDLEAAVLNTSGSMYQTEPPPPMDPNRGDILIHEIGAINLANSDRQADEIIETANGQIIIKAQSKITVFDNSVGDDGEDLKQDPEIIARGSEHGRIDLESIEFTTSYGGSTEPPYISELIHEIELLDLVQLQAQMISQEFPEPETRDIPESIPEDGEITRDQRSVFLKADSIVLGEQIEINTGETQGVARIFASRPPDVMKVLDPVSGNFLFVPPAFDDTGSAFFIPSTVTTNILEQAFVNDAVGILTLKIGQSGELGLTINIDWGAPVEDDGGPMRFQQINGIPADQAVFVDVVEMSPGEPLDPVIIPGGPAGLTIRHFYTQDNIASSDANLRRPPTDPLEVRFAVRHHQSIRLESNTIQQGESEVQEIPGGVASSTDNPNTPRNPSQAETTASNGFENGRAQFIIPSLTIPQAFIPVRDVIPEFETRQPVVVDEAPIVLTQVTFDRLESGSSPSVGRDEYFQIRALNPDPDADDLAVVRLPPDILSGNKLIELLSKLPDGRYEIEYVLDDSNIRPIWRVDVRLGKAISTEELDEEVLKLIPIDIDSLLNPQESSETELDAPTDDLDPNDLSMEVATPTRMNDESSVSATHTSDQRAAVPPVVAGAVLASTLRRRRANRENRRLSTATRFASRRRNEGSRE